MRIRYIIHNSLLLPFKRYKVFIGVYLIALVCEAITKVFYSIDIGHLSLFLMIFNSLITLMLFGLMLSLTNHAVKGADYGYFDFKDNFIEGIKEYTISIFYILMAMIFSSFVTIPTGVMSKIINIQNYLLNHDINTTLISIHELSHVVPRSLQVDFHHSLQIHLIITTVIFLILLSLGFISKTILSHTGNLKKAMDPKIIFRIIRNIGYLRYLKFLALISLVLIIVVNFVIFLDYYLSDSLLSAFLETFVLFFSTSAFYNVIFT